MIVEWCVQYAKYFLLFFTTTIISKYSFLILTSTNVPFYPLSLSPYPFHFFFHCASGRRTLRIYTMHSGCISSARGESEEEENGREKMLNRTLGQKNVGAPSEPIVLVFICPLYSSLSHMFIFHTAAATTIQARDFRKKMWKSELTNTNKFFSHIYDSTFFFEGSIGLNICFEVSVERQAVVDIHSKGVHLVRKIKRK